MWAIGQDEGYVFGGEEEEHIYEDVSVCVCLFTIDEQIHSFPWSTVRTRLTSRCIRTYVPIAGIAIDIVVPVLLAGRRVIPDDACMSVYGVV